MVPTLFCKNRNLDLMGFTQGLIINDDTIKENASKLTIKEADKFTEQQKIIDKFNQFELYDLTNSKMLEKRKLNGNLFLAYNHSLKKDKHNNMCVPNFLYSKNSHSNKIISYTRRLENPMTSLNNQVLNRPVNAVKCPNAKAIGLPRLMLHIGKVWFSLCVPNHRDFTEFDLQRIPYMSHTSYLQRRNFAHFLR